MQHEIVQNLILLSVPLKPTEQTLTHLAKRLNPDFKSINRIDLNLKLSKLLNELGFKIRKSDFDVKPRLDKIILDITNYLLKLEIDRIESETVILDAGSEDSMDQSTINSEDLSILMNDIEQEQQEFENLKLRFETLIKECQVPDSEPILDNLDELQLEYDELNLNLEYWTNWFEFAKNCEHIDYDKYKQLILDGKDYELNLDNNSICNNVDIYKGGTLDVDMYLQEFVRIYSRIESCPSSIANF